MYDVAPAPPSSLLGGTPHAAVLADPLAGLDVVSAGGANSLGGMGSLVLSGTLGAEGMLHGMLPLLHAAQAEMGEAADRLGG